MTEPDLYRDRVAGLWTAQAATGVALGAAVADCISSLVPPADTFPVYGGVGALGVVASALALPTPAAARPTGPSRDMNEPGGGPTTAPLPPTVPQNRGPD
jgi:hypothetical protein